MNTPIPTNSSFEAAVDALVSGDLSTLRALLRQDPDLARMRSSRPHRCTLLHYLGANGVEQERQTCPANATTLARSLLEAGAEVDAVADLYGGSTALNLVATSIHPQEAGVQLPLMECLLDHGADLGRASLHACLGNNRLAAAEFLAARGAALDFAAAAGLGRLAEVEAALRAEPSLLSASPEAGAPTSAEQGFLWACAFGHDAVVTVLLDAGISLSVQDRFGQTGLHHAAMGRRLTTLRLLLARGADLEVCNGYGGTVLGQALWLAAHASSTEQWTSTISLLLESGASIPRSLPPVSPDIDALLAVWGHAPDRALHW